MTAARAIPPSARMLGRAAWVAAAVLIAAPAVAMLFTSEVQWTASDFALLAGLLGAVLLPFQLALPRVRNLAALAGVGAALCTAFLIVMVNLAVGIVGDGSDPINALFFALILLPLIGAIRYRGSPARMAAVMAATAALHATILAALAVLTPEPGVWLSGLFVAGWAASAVFFAVAARMPDWHSRAV